MPLWIWLILAVLVFLASYDKRSGNLQNFFGPELIVESHGSSSRETQSNSNTDESNRGGPSLSGRA